MFDRGFRPWPLIRNLIPLAFPALLLAAAGLAIIYSLSPADSSGTASDFAKKQAIFLGISIAVFAAVSNINYNRFRVLIPLIYVACVAALAGLLLFTRPIKGARCWYNVGGVSVQVSEFAKIFLILLWAKIYTFRMSDTKKLLLIGISTAPVLALIAAEPDMGMTCLIAATMLFVIFLASRSIKLFLAVLAIVVVCGGVAFPHLKDYQRARINSFFGGGGIFSKNDSERAITQQSQSVASIAYGGTRGRGLGSLSEKKFLIPERHNDFIFSAVGQSFGLAGAFVIIALFFWLIAHCYSVAIATRDIFGRIATSGIAFMLGMQAFVNIGMNIGLAPVTGLTLPFMSYGGSSLLASFLALGIVNSVRTHPVATFSCDEMPSAEFEVGFK